MTKCTESWCTWLVQPSGCGASCLCTGANRSTSRCRAVQLRQRVTDRLGAPRAVWFLTCLWIICPIIIHLEDLRGTDWLGRGGNYLSSAGSHGLFLLLLFRETCILWHTRSLYQFCAFRTVFLLCFNYIRHLQVNLGKYYLHGEVILFLSFFLYH